MAKDRLRPLFDKLFSILTPKNIVSIGSGAGKIESEIKNNFGYDVVCIDPDPMKFNTSKKIFKEPLYPFYTEEIASKYKNPILLIIWPWFCLHKDIQTPYDFDSLQLAANHNMEAFLISFAPCGTSGSKEIIKLLTEPEPLDLERYKKENLRDYVLFKYSDDNNLDYENINLSEEEITQMMEKNNDDFIPEESYLEIIHIPKTSVTINDIKYKLFDVNSKIIGSGLNPLGCNFCDAIYVKDGLI